MPEWIYEHKRLNFSDLEIRKTQREEYLSIPLHNLREDNLEINTINVYRENLTTNLSENLFRESINTVNIFQQIEAPIRREKNLYLPYPENDPHTCLGDVIRQFAGLYPTVPEVVVPRILDERQLARMGDAVDGLAIVRNAFSDIPAEELTALLASVEVSMSGSTGQARAKLVRTLLDSSDSIGFSLGVVNAGLSLDQLPELVLDEGILSLVSVMLEHPDKYRMQLGVILSQVKLEQIPEELKVKLKPHISGLEFSVETSHGSWYLCGAAESRLAQAIDEGGVMAIGEEDNSYFLLKFRGKLSALCLQDVATSDGKVFIRGNWYSPTSDDARDTLRNEFDKGRGRTSLQLGSWALMRPLKVDEGIPDELLDKAMQVANRIPEMYPSDEVVVNGVVMKLCEYRQSFKEKG